MKRNKILRTISLALLSVLLLFIVMWGALQFSSVQTFVVHKITNSLQKKLGTRINIGRVDIEFFKTIVLEDVYIEDKTRDTLMYAGALKANLSVFSLFKKEIGIGQLDLINSRVNLKKDSSVFNFQFIVDSFQPSQVKDSTVTPWLFDIDRISIVDANFTYHDDLEYIGLKSQIGQLSIVVDQLDLDNNKIVIDQLALSESIVDYKFEKQVVAITQPEIASLALPEIPVDFTVNNLRVKDTQLSYVNKLGVKRKSQLDFDNLRLEDVNVDMEDIILRNSQISANVKEIKFADHSRFELKSFSGNLLVNNDVIDLKSISISTNQSKLNTDLKLSYNELNDLLALNSSVSIDANFDDVRIAASDLRLINSGWMKGLSTGKNSHLLINGSIAGNTNEIKLRQFDLEVFDRLNLKVSGTVKNVLEIEKLSFDVDIKNLSTSYKKIKSILPDVNLDPALGAFEEVRLRSKLKGSINDFKGTHLELVTSNSSYFKGDISASNLLNKNTLSFLLNVDKFQSVATDLSPFFRDSIPPILVKLDTVGYKGVISGDANKYTANGLATTALGNLKSDLSITFTPDFKDAVYTGELYLMDFDLGVALADTSQFGSTTVYFIGEGRGLALEDLTANAEAIIEQLEFNNYQYENVNIEGKFAEREFDGFADFSDDNAEFKFLGNIDFSNDIPDYNFKARIDTINFKKLNITNTDFGLSTKADIDFSGNSIDNISGSLVFTEFSLSDSSVLVTDDSVRLESRILESGKKILSFESSYINADIVGDYNISLLPSVFTSYLNDYFPLILDDAQQASITDNEGQQFILSASIEDGKALNLLNLPVHIDLDRSTIVAEFDSDTKKLKIDGLIVDATYGDVKSDSIVIRSTGSAKRINNSIEIIGFKGSGIELPQVDVNLKLRNDSLLFQFAAEDVLKHKLLSLGGSISSQNEDYFLRLDRKAVFNDKNWNVDANNVSTYSTNRLYVDQLSIKQDNKVVRLQSEGSVSDVNMQPLSLDFKNFELSEIMTVLGQDESYSGAINGNIKAINLLSQPYYNADFMIENIKSDSVSVGDLVLIADSRQSSSLIDVRLGLGNDASRSLSAIGTFDVLNNRIDVDGQFDRFELMLLDPFLMGVVHDTDGMLSGKYKVSGTTSKPRINGDVQLLEMITTVDFLNTPIKIPNHTIQINNEAILIGEMEIRDVNDNPGILFGRISHSYFSGFDMNLGLSSDKFKFMDTKKINNPQFWGTLFLDADVGVSGSFDRPVININAKTLPNTKFSLQTAYTDEAFNNTDYIIFANPNNIDSVQLDSLQRRYSVNNRLRLEMNMDIEVTPSAELVLILDPVTGDKVVGRGSSNMVFKLSPSGDVTLLGNYVIDYGEYNFSYGELLKRNFDIESGSTINFVGDPLDSRLDITAVYVTNTSPLELVQQESPLSDTEVSSLQRRTPVRTELKLNGQLSEPIISFDITLPENQGNAFDNAINQKLTRLREDPAEMNKQVFSLLLFNNFFPTSTNGDFLSGAGNNIALSSVSKLVTNQLSKLTEKYIRGVELSVDVESYQKGNQNLQTELQIGLSKSLFNDRLKIEAATNVDIASAPGNTNQQVAGDFILTYKLTKSGKYLVKVFRKSDFDILKDQNSSKNGISLSARRSYGKLKKKE